MEIVKDFLFWFLAHCEGHVVIKDCTFQSSDGKVYQIPDVECECPPNIKNNSEWN